MPIRRSNLTRPEYRDYRARLLRLKEMGLEVGCAGDFLQEPERLRQRLKLEQVDEELAKIYDLPGSGTVVVVHAKLTVVPRKVLITGFEMTMSWDDLPLSLDDPEGIPFYRDFLAGLYPIPLTILNPWLTGESALCHSQREGVIIARGQRSIPSEYHDHTLQTIELSLCDERDYEYRFTFQGRVDRSVKRKYEPRLKGRHKAPRMGLREALRRKKPSSVPTPAMTITHAALQRLQKLKPEEARDERKQQARVKARTKREKGNRNQGPSSYAQELAEERSRFLQALSPVKKPIEASSLDVPREETDEPIGTG